MKKIRKILPKYVERLCVECGNPFAILRRYKSKINKCKHCRKYDQLLRQRAYLKRYRLKKKIINN